MTETLIALALMCLAALILYGGLEELEPTSHKRRMD